MEILERESHREPSFFPVYLGDGRLDLDELRWLHHRRRLDLAQADLVLVPSEHIAKLVRDRSQVPASRVRVIPYAADPDRFRPRPLTPPNQTKGECRFLFAGGITQRKGLSDLLKAWSIVRRPGWSLSLVGAAPKAAESLVPKDDPSIHLLGKVAYGNMPKVMSEHDLFVFPSLFEGSAVVCYEALAAGLPVITTPQSGSVVRDSLEGRICEAADYESLASAMVDLGMDPEGRARMAESARLRALDHTWDHYRERVMQALEEVDDMSFRENLVMPQRGSK
jgi:glycosyltransferase involved in cell wall biosynthesis